MKEYISILKKTQIFAGVGEEDIESMLVCLGARCRDVKKGEYILRCGEYLKDIMVLVKGKLHIQKDDYWGNCSILGQINKGEIFGEAYVAPGSEAMPNDVIALENSTIILFDVTKMLTTCSASCRFHSMVVQNMFYAISEKNRRLVQKISHMAKRTTREKLMSYLSEEAKRQQSSRFIIPFNRQQLADFLSVDRSAMSNELCKMRDDGLLEFEKNHFKLL